MLVKQYEVTLLVFDDGSKMYSKCIYVETSSLDPIRAVLDETEKLLEQIEEQTYE